MRLSPEIREVIKESVREVFGPSATVRLFGSRANDEARGGDIDLLVECSEPVQGRVKKALTLTAMLQMRLGDQRIDVVVRDPRTIPQPVHEIARKTGVPI
ncbi:MAG: nucleotidyltransferase domain-containing protein [Betaproteobacteria bacterium]|nr:nucleotidyltransferase domain-containing protein [Betaproteobacteria bacterium]